MLDEMLESLIRRAAESEFGISISTSNIASLKRKCYIARRELMEQGETSMQDLTFTESPDGGAELWIIRRSKLGFDPRPIGLRNG